MAETSLARQLKKLAVPQTSLLLQDRVRPSLLFDPREAATIDRDTIFAIGITGLESLQVTEPLFSTFEKTLFSEASKTLERSVQTQEVNARLNEAIQRFLTTLSPYFLLRASHKSLEWLISRFHIHLFNVDDLMACILPYHETRIFARTVQLLDLSNPSGRWYWLQPLQKPGIPLPKKTLINHCYKDLSFMQFVCNLVPRMIEVYGKEATAPLQTVISFYMATVVGALEFADKITENMVALLLPFILQGIKSTNLDYRASTYLIVCQLSRKTKLTSTMTKELVTRLAQSIKPELQSECLSSLLVIYNTQNLNFIPKIAFKALMAMDVAATLEELSQQCYTSALLLPFMKRLIGSALMEAVSRKRKVASVGISSKKKLGKQRSFYVLLSVVKNIMLNKEEMLLIIRMLVGKFIKLRRCFVQGEKKKDIEALQERAVDVFKRLEKRFPTYFDEAVAEELTSATPKQREAMHELLNFTVSSQKYSPVPQTDTTLFLGLSHANEKIRTAAVDSLVGKILEGMEMDESFVQDSFLARLHDDSPLVVRSVLSLKEEIFNIIPSPKAMEALIAVLQKQSTKDRSKWHKVQNKVLQVLCSICPGNNHEENSVCLLTAVLPYLLITSGKDLDQVKIILNSSLAENHPVLQGLKTACEPLLSTMNNSDCKTAHSIWNFNKITFATLAQRMIVLQDTAWNLLQSMKEVAMSVQPKGNNVKLKLFLLEMLPMFVIGLNPGQRLKFAVDAVEICAYILKNDELFSMDDLQSINAEETILACYNALLQNRLHASVVIKCLENILHSVQVGSELKEHSWYYPDVMDSDDSTKFYFLTLLFDLLTEMASANAEGLARSSFRHLVAEFFMTQFPTMLLRMRFLATLWTQHYLPAEMRTTALSPVTQIRSLTLAASLMCSVTDSPMDDDLVFPSLLVALTSPLEPVRSVGLTCLRAYLDHGRATVSPYGHLGEHVIQHSEEIQADSQQLCQGLALWLTSDNSSAISRTRRKQSASAGTKSALQCLLELTVRKDISDYIRLGVLKALSLTVSQEILTALIPLLKSILAACNLNKVLSAPKAEVVELILAKYVPETTAALGTLDSEALTVFETVLWSEAKREGNGGIIREIALKVVTKKWFYALPNKDVQQHIFSQILDLSLDCQETTMGNRLYRVLRKISYDAQHLVKELQFEEKDCGEAKTVRKMKKQSTYATSSLGTDRDVLENGPWKRIILVLEVIQNKQLDNANLLVPILFGLLKQSLTLDSHANLEYLRQLILTSLTDCCQHPAAVMECEQQFGVGTVVQCIHASENPQTHHHALLLLNLAATMFPEHVLNNIMAIFTFMGASLVRQDNSYSFQVITQTVETIIPALLQASRQKETEDETQHVVASVTRVFVDALPDIPGHRQLPLFSKLISTLDPMNYLWLLTLQFCERCVTNPSFGLSRQGTAASDVGTISPVEEFMLSLCHCHTPSIQVVTGIKLLKYLTELSSSNETLPNEPEPDTSSVEPFDIRRHTVRQLRHFEYTVVSMLTSLLSSQTFVEQVAELTAESSKQLLPSLQEMIELTLCRIQHIAASATCSEDQSFRKFQKALSSKLYDLLDKINLLLPSSEFLNVMTGLLSAPLAMVRRKAMEMLSAKLAHQPRFFSSEDTPQLLNLVQLLVRVVRRQKTSSPTKSPTEEEVAINQQTALFCLKLLCKLLCTEHPEPFKKVLKAVIKVIGKPQSPQVTANALLCLAELCHGLQAHALPHLAEFMPHVLGYLQDSRNNEENSLFLLSGVTAAQRIVENLCLFLGPYIPQLLSQICLISARTDTVQVTPVQQRLKLTYKHLSNSVPFRVLLPAIHECYIALSVDHPMAVSPLMSVLADRLASMDKNEISKHMPELQTFFLTALDFRTQNSKLPRETSNLVESHVITTMLALVLKLTENSFRPVFYRLYDWATTEEESKKDRLVTFYRVTDSLAEKLKSLFVLFASHFIKNAALLVDKLNSSKIDMPYFGDEKDAVEKACYLLGYLFDTLHKCFLHDNEGFVNKERFNILMQPLVDQIENTLGDEKAYQNRIVNHLSPCLAQFAVAARDDSLWKVLNYQILLKTRHSEAKVRFATLQILREVVRKLSEDYLPLLPESIPFLAELMEDDSFEVEQLCQSIISDMEQALGEPLMKYF